MEVPDRQQTMLPRSSWLGFESSPQPQDNRALEILAQDNAALERMARHLVVWRTASLRGMWAYGRRRMAMLPLFALMQQIICKTVAPLLLITPAMILRWNNPSATKRMLARNPWPTRALLPRLKLKTMFLI